MSIVRYPSLDGSGTALDRALEHEDYQNDCSRFDTSRADFAVAEAAKAAPENNLTVVDGYLVDDQGEIHGHVQAQADFHVVDRNSAEWVLQKMCEEDAQLVALDAMERAIVDNLQALRRQHLSRRR